MKLFIALAVGLIAGIIDILPMIFQKLDRYSIFSALIQWIVVGFVIFYIDFGISGWLKGLILAVLLAIPIVILVMKADLKSVPIILTTSAVLGSLVGLVHGILTKSGKF